MTTKRTTKVLNALYKKEEDGFYRVIMYCPIDKKVITSVNTNVGTIQRTFGHALAMANNNRSKLGTFRYLPDATEEELHLWTTSV